MNRKWITSVLSAVGLLALILDSRTGFSAAQEGITLCIQTLIPSMFPFFILSMILTSAMAGQPIPLLRPLSKLCRIPEGAESLLAIGFLGGYPVGAQNVLSSYHQGVISKEDVLRMAVFCNNAGPAFLFGYLGTLFDAPVYLWLLWLIHIVSALLVGWILPGGSNESISTVDSELLSMPHALNQAIRVMAQVCGWVILFRVFMGFLDRWLFWAFPDSVRILLTGFLELSNGCVFLSQLPSQGLRFIFASTLLGFGGICVNLQTRSISGSIHLSMYLPGKAFQGCISFLMTAFLQRFLPNSDPVSLKPLVLIFVGFSAIILLLILRKQEKPVAISQNLLYNQASCEKRRTICSSERKSKNPAPTALSAQS